MGGRGGQWARRRPEVAFSDAIHCSAHARVKCPPLCVFVSYTRPCVAHVCSHVCVVRFVMEECAQSPGRRFFCLASRAWRRGVRERTCGHCRFRRFQKRAPAAFKALTSRCSDVARDVARGFPSLGCAGARSVRVKGGGCVLPERGGFIRSPKGRIAACGRSRLSSLAKENMTAIAILEMISHAACTRI